MPRPVVSRGFTLIELLVVIAIIAILAAILFPVFAKAREKSRQTACMNNERQAGIGILMYAQDHEEILPQADAWVEASGAGKALDCGSSRRKGSSGNSDYLFMAGRNTNTTPGVTQDVLLSGKALAEYTAPADTPMLFDRAEGAPVPWLTYDNTTCGVGVLNLDVSGVPSLDFRHNKGIMCAFIDGHVQLLKRADVTTELLLRTRTDGEPVIANPCISITGTGTIPSYTISADAVRTTHKTPVLYAGTNATAVKTWLGGSGTSNAPSWLNTIANSIVTGVGFDESGIDAFAIPNGFSELTIAWGTTKHTTIFSRNSAGNQKQYNARITITPKAGLITMKRVAIIAASNPEGWAVCRDNGTKVGVAGAEAKFTLPQTNFSKTGTAYYSIGLVPVYNSNTIVIDLRPNAYGGGYAVAFED
jgi:prepilin-type N-terminal cleavage/methylation domain-containing protein/prepilin-type processing-associated H-X9-DG protein